MTDREAIERMKLLEKGGTNFSKESNDACRVALEALQEREERENGCEYCQDNFNFWATEISGYFDKKDIKFCIHCGRKLKTAMPGEEV